MVADEIQETDRRDQPATGGRRWLNPADFGQSRWLRRSRRLKINSGQRRELRAQIQGIGRIAFAIKIVDRQGGGDVDIAGRIVNSPRLQDCRAVTKLENFDRRKSRFVVTAGNRRFQSHVVAQEKLQFAHFNRIVRRAEFDELGQIDGTGRKGRRSGNRRYQSTATTTTTSPPPSPPTP